MQAPICARMCESFDGDLPWRLVLTSGWAASIIGATRMSALGLAAGCAACGAPDCVEGSALWADPPAEAYEVCGDLVVTGRSPSEIEVLQRVEAVRGSLIFETNPELVEIPELPGLALIGGSLSISDNRELSRIKGFPALVEVGGGVYVGENPELTNFVLGDALTRAHSLFIALNPQLHEMRGALVTLADDLTIVDNPALEVLEFPALEAVQGNFYIGANVALRELAFPALRVVEGAWHITDNASLETLIGFPALEGALDVQVSGNTGLRELTFDGPYTGCISFAVFDNEALERLEGSPEVRFSEMTEVYVASNPALKAVEGFAGVSSLDRLIFEGHVQLVEVPAFAALRGISELQIVDNAALTGPQGWLPKLEHADDIRIYRNSSLPPSRVDELLSRIKVEETPRVGDNMGENTALDPCPWPADNVCDALAPNGGGTGLCASDPEDCGV